MCFNALNGLLPFLLTMIISSEENAKMLFQRPKRASSISTAPSGTPHKHWLSSLIFAGICLNILKSAVFWKFSGMFTLCSYFQLIFHLPLCKHYTLASSKIKVTFLIFVIVFISQLVAPSGISALHFQIMSQHI